MGRCYEFGAVITEGCEHPMAVHDEGGRCHCTSCGSECLGRFKGCAAVVSRPGYVPVGAPTARRALPAHGSLPEPAVEIVLAASEPVAPPSALTDAADRSAEAIERVRAEMERRDMELAEAFDRLAVSHSEVTDELRAQRQQLQTLTAVVDRLADEVVLFRDRSSLPLLGLRRRAQ